MAVQYFLTRNKRKWLLLEADEDEVRRLARQLRVHPAVARVAVARGKTGEAARRYLDPRLTDLTAPEEMAGLEVVVERLGQAVLDGELVGVFGDYDVDGVSSAALVGDYLRQCGGKYHLRVARRDEGYGFGVGQAREMIEAGCGLLVLLDCGTSDLEAVIEARDAGLDVVALDHHKVSRPDWPGLALVNPHHPHCGHPYKGLASVGLAFYLVARLRRFLEDHGQQGPDPRASLDLVALGTIADVAPLDGDNRVLASMGLRQLNDTARPGLRELMRLGEVKGLPTAYDVGWKLGPRLNAPGRMGDAAISLNCLWQDDGPRAKDYARQCHQINEQRKEIQKRIEDEALEQGAQQVELGRSFLLAAGEGWHPGIVGIVASRLVDTFDLPAVVAALEGETARGSARSVPGVDMVDLLKASDDLLVRYGGHKMAAGLTFHSELLEPLRQRLHEATEPLLQGRDVPVLKVDGLLDLDRIDLKMCTALEKLGPHGMANPAPTFAARGVRVEDVRVIKDQHLKLQLRSGQRTQEAMGFGMRAQEPLRGQHLDVLFRVEVNTWREPRVQLKLKDLELSNHACWEE